MKLIREQAGQPPRPGCRVIAALEEGMVAPSILTTALRVLLYFAIALAIGPLPASRPTPS